MSERGRAWLVDLEGGVKLRAYRDSGGIPTIGVGQIFWQAPGGYRRVEMGDKLESKLQGLNMFSKALAPVEATVDSCTADTITAQQFDAFCSLAYNIGQHAFARSSAVRLFNSGAPVDEVCEAIERWNRVNGSISEGLIARRECEVDAFRHGRYHAQGERAAA
jgi:lysozyme